jgi:CIC family chloride channel protein
MRRSAADRIRTFLRDWLLSQRWAEILAGSDQQLTLLLWSGVVGALGAVAGALFRGLESGLGSLVWGGSGDLLALVAGAANWKRVIVPAAGGVVAGLILVYGMRVTRASQRWDILEAVVLRDGVLKFRPALVQGLSSLVTVSTGESVGREGPLVLMAATLSSKVGQWIHLSTRHLRILTACGVAAGIASAYNAPIGAALFAMEIILGNFSMEVFAPLVFSSVIATLLSRGLHGAEPVFSVPAFEMVSAWEIGLYLLLGIASGLVASAFLRGIRASGKLFARLGFGRPLGLGIVGLLLGMALIPFPELCGGGGGGLGGAFLEASTLARLALALMALKLAFTSLAVGAGAVGGVFTPSLFVGAALGSAFGSIAGLLAPASTASPGAYALVGMGCLLAGTTHAPIMAVLMVFEMSLSYTIVLPLMLSCAAASLVARSLSPKSVYTEALGAKGAPAALTPEAQVMSSMKVKDIMRREFEAVPPDLPLPQVLDRFLKSRRNHVYVMDAEGRFMGAIGFHDLKESLRDPPEVTFVIALDLIRPSFETTVPEERLDLVMEKLSAQDSERLPVLDGPETRRLIGTVSKRDIFGVYSLEVLHRRSLVARFQSEAAGEEADPTYVELPAHYRVEGVPASASLVGSTMAEARLRDRYGVTVLLIRRRDATGGEARIVPEPDTRLEAGDRLVVFGPEEGLAALRGA